MPDANDNLFLYEAIELRAEYDARLKALKDLLPETRENRQRPLFHGDLDARRRPAPGFDIAACREEVHALTARKRKLNGAIQRANFDAAVAVGGERMSLAEALELRKAVNAEIGELTAQLGESAYERIVYKEERDIVEPPDRDYREVSAVLEEKRRLFRELNRGLRAVAHEVTVDFKDES